MAGKLVIRSIDEGDFKTKSVLLRVDINSPVDKPTGKIINDNRIRKSVPTIRDLSERGAKLVLISHQGDTTDYLALISLREHADRLSEAVGKRVGFIEDIAGPAAVERIESLKTGEILLLDNLRYLTEEVSTFEDSVKLEPGEMLRAYLVRRERKGRREETSIDRCPPNRMIFDIGSKTASLYSEIVAGAKTVFVNGPPGVYEEQIASRGTQSLWQAVESAQGFTVAGGGDTVTSFTRFTDISKIDYVSTAGGALIRYLSGVELPLLKAMKH